MNSKEVGDISVAVIMASLIKSGHSVLLPFGDNTRYDLAVDSGDRLIKLQCKTASLRKNGVLAFNTSSITTKNGKQTKNYYTPNEIDYFMVYSPDLDKVYLIPFGECKGTLRVEGENNNKNIKWAKDYEFNGDVTQR